MSANTDNKYGSFAAPWFMAALVVACGLVVTVLYGVAGYTIISNGWQVNYAVFVVGVVLLIATCAYIVLSTDLWTYIIWAPELAVFAVGFVLIVLAGHVVLPVATALMMCAVFSAHLLYWVVVLSFFTSLRSQWIVLSGMLLALVNTGIAFYIGAFFASLFPVGAQGYSGVSMLMAAILVVLFVMTALANRMMFGSLSTRFTLSRDADVQNLEHGHDVSEKAVATNVSETLRRRVDSYAKEYGLTPREAEVAFYTAQGFSCAYIADKLVVSNSTVRFHQQNIYRKFKVHSRNDFTEIVSAQ